MPRSKYSILGTIKDNLLRDLKNLKQQTALVKLKLRNLRLIERTFNRPPKPESKDMEMYFHQLLSFDDEDGPYLPLDKRIESLINYGSDSYTWLRHGEKPGKYELCPVCRSAVRMKVMNMEEEVSDEY